MEFQHTSVLLHETVDALRVSPGGLYLDGTLGGGGHSREILARGGCVVGIDRDAEAIAAACVRLAEYGARFTAIRGNFHDAKALVQGPLDGALLGSGRFFPPIGRTRAGFFLP